MTLSLPDTMMRVGVFAYVFPTFAQNLLFCHGSTMRSSWSMQISSSPFPSDAPSFLPQKKERGLKACKTSKYLHMSI